MSNMNEAGQFNNVNNIEAYQGDYFITICEDGVIIYEEADDIVIAL